MEQTQETTTVPETGGENSNEQQDNARNKEDNKAQTTEGQGQGQQPDLSTSATVVEEVTSNTGQAGAGAVGGQQGEDGGQAGEEEDKKSKDEDTDDDETETTEESPCGRWLKRREEVRNTDKIDKRDKKSMLNFPFQIKYRDVPGIDTAFLAMDSEEGVEVVWNEAQFSTSKKFKAQEEKLKIVFDALTRIEHPNIVHFHHYWLDPGSVNEKEKKPPRVRGFIQGSLEGNFEIENPFCSSSSSSPSTCLPAPSSSSCARPRRTTARSSFSPGSAGALRSSTP